MSRIVAVLLSSATVAASIVGIAAPSAAAPVPAPAAAAPSSRYVAMSPQRLLDTRQRSDPHFGAVAGGGQLSLKVAGVDSVPADASAVALNVTVVHPRAGGHLTVFPRGQSQPTVSNLNYTPDETVANAVIVQVGSSAAVDLVNSSRGATDVLADVTGYFAAPAASTPGGFTSLAPRRLLDTRTRTGGYHRTVPAEGRVAFPVGGVAGIPSSASAVVLNVTVTGPTRGGHITAYPTGSTIPTASNVNFKAGQTVPDLVVVPLGSAGRVTLLNGSHGTLALLADVAGYFAGGAPVSPGAFGALSPGRVLDTRTGNGAPRRAVAADGVLTLTLAGRAGVPLSSVSAVVLTVTATSPGAGGHLVVYPSGTQPRSSTLNFTKGQTVPNLVVAPLNASGALKIANVSHGTTQIFADVAGYVTTSSVPAVSGATSARYPNELTGGSGDVDAMTRQGTAAAESGAQFVLLDVGAQSVSAPTLNRANPGVVLTQTTSRTPLRYPALVSALKGYLSGFAAHANGASVTIAIGTNNDGVFNPKAADYYSPADRGKAWADAVVSPLRAAAAAAASGITVVGADDIEAAFASTRLQAQQWESAYLDATPAQLIYNGDANSCPATFGHPGATCAFGWTESQYYSLAHRDNRIQVLPQIFFPGEAVKWANIDATGDSSGQRQLSFVGSLTERPLDSGTLTAAQGRAALYRAISSVVSSPSVPYALDIDTDV